MGEFAAALSEHPDAALAAAEVVEEVAAALGPGRRPDLALVFFTPPHLEAADEVAGAVRAGLEPVTLLGCGAVAVVGGAREVEGTPAVSLWAARTMPTEAFHLTATAEPSAAPGAAAAPPAILEGWPPGLPDDAEALLVLADPLSFPVEAVLQRLGDERAGLPVVGGLASAGQRPGANRLVLDDEVHTSGAVVAVIRAPAVVRTVVSQGCRPVGVPLVVTRAERNVVYELAGRPALERLGEAAESMPEADRHLLNTGVHLGRVIDEHRSDFGRGDFLVRNVLGGDVSSGAIAVGDLIEVGSTVQYQVRDAASADEDLRDLLGGSRAGGALLFTCNGRGTNLFAEADHDARLLAAEVGPAPVAGMFCAGELGPIGGRNFLHGFTASVVLVDVPEVLTA